MNSVALFEPLILLLQLFQEIHGLHDQGVSTDNISSHLSPWASALFEFLPPFIRKQVISSLFYELKDIGYRHFYNMPECQHCL